MKQHLLAKQLKELDFEDRIILISLATGLTREYVRDEYKKGMKDEDGMLMEYGFELKVGDLIEIIENFTNEFPIPEISGGKYRVKTSLADSDFQPTYCDSLFEVVKVLLKNKHIIIE
jgi:hypothetical protein